MHIFFVLTPPFDPYSGGVQMSTHKIGSYMVGQGHSVSIYSFATEGHSQPQQMQLFHDTLPGGFAETKNILHMQQCLEDVKPEVVINQMPYVRAISEALAESQRHIPYLLLGCLRNTLYSVKLNLDSYIGKVIPAPLQLFFRNPLGKKLAFQYHKKRHIADLRHILDHYDYFVMFGPPNARELDYFVADYKKEKRAYIPNSIPAVLDEVPKKEKKILWLSRLSYAQKRADLILPFWKKVAPALPDWTFEVVGDGDATAELAAEIERENISRITLHGKQVPDDYYRAAPIYIMTSSFEGFPNTLIEAQSFGAVPIVFKNYPVVDWVIKDGENGFLISPFDVDEMAQKTISLAKNAERREQMMVASLINARRFTIERVGQQWLDFFAENGKR